jgi:excisionase family DNA binding protein
VAIDTSETVTVAEAAKRLGRSEEQVRRYLRAGRLKGQRVGNQWFIDERDLASRRSEGPRPLIPLEQRQRIAALRARLAPRFRGVDILDLIRRQREDG